MSDQGRISRYLGEMLSLWQWPDGGNGVVKRYADVLASEPDPFSEKEIQLTCEAIRIGIVFGLDPRVAPSAPQVRQIAAMFRWSSRWFNEH